MTSTLKDSLASQGILQGTKTESTPTPKSPFEGLRKLATDPKFKALPSDEKMKVKGQLFDKYLAPYYKSKGMEVSPNLKEHFVRSEDPTYKGDQVKPISKAPTLDEKTGDFLAHLGMQAGKQGVKVVHGGVDAADKVENIVERVIKYASPVNIKIDGKETPFGAGELGQKFQSWFDREQGFNKRTLDAKEDEFNTYLGSNYQDSFAIKAAEAPVRAAGSTTSMFARSPEYLAAPGITSVGARGILGKAALTDLLANGTFIEKMSYRAIKGAAEGYLVGKAEDQHGGQLHGTAIFFSGLEAAGPLASKIARPVADKAIAFVSRLLAYGGTSRVEQAIAAVDKATPEQIAKADTTKITGAIVKATAQMRDDVAAKLGYKDYAEAKASGRSGQQKVAKGVAAIIKQANAEITVHNPELVRIKAAKDVKEWSSNPLGAKLVGQLQQIGVDPIKATTETVVKNTRVAAGNLSQEKKAIIEALGGSIDKGLEVATEQADKKMLAKTSKKSEFAGLGPGATSVNESGMFNKLIKLVETNIPMQSKTHTLTFMWGIEKNLPQEVRGAVAQMMKELYGPNIKTWDAAARKLDSHLDQMIASGHIGGADKRGVFHSTKLTGEPTKWQGQLEDEVEQVRRRGEAEKTTRSAENKVPIEKRASTVIKKEEAEKTARRIEGRTETKKQLETSTAMPGVSEATKTKGKHFDINKEAERLAKKELGPDYAKDLAKFTKRANEIKEQLIKNKKE